MNNQFGVGNNPFDEINGKFLADHQIDFSTIDLMPVTIDEEIQDKLFALEDFFVDVLAKILPFTLDICLDDFITWYIKLMCVFNDIELVQENPSAHYYLLNRLGISIELETNTNSDEAMVITPSGIERSFGIYEWKMNQTITIDAASIPLLSRIQGNDDEVRSFKHHFYALLGELKEFKKCFSVLENPKCLLGGKKFRLQTRPTGRPRDDKYNISYQNIRNGMPEEEAFSLYCKDAGIIKQDKVVRDSWKQAMDRRGDKTTT